MHRAYALLHVKQLAVETRRLTGLATSPTPDRAGDIIEPLGVTFTNPVPLLLFHDPTQPVGRVWFDRPTAEGVTFTAEIPPIPEPGVLQDRVEEAWQSVTHGLIFGVSIGVRPLPGFLEVLKRGLRFLKSEILELSLVTIPSNRDATILTVKALDGATRAALGHASSGAPEALPIVTMGESPAMPQTLAEQITKWEASRAAKVGRLNTLMTEAGDQTLAGEAAEEHDRVTLEVKSIDTHLVRLHAQEQMNVASATRVAGQTPEQAAATRAVTPQITVKSTLPKGTGLVRYAMALLATKGEHLRAIEYARQWEDSTPEVILALKAAVAPGNTTDATWAGPLVQLQPLAAEFLELLRPATILGRIPNLRKVPFNVSVPAQTAGGSYGWVGQGAPKPVTALAFSTVTLGIAKAAGIIVITEELAKLSTPSAEETVRQDMIDGIAQFLDQQFTDPAVAEVVNVSPASITNGTVAIPSSGPTPDNARADIQALIQSFLAANLSLRNAVLLMSEANAFALGTALNPLGQPLFPGLGLNPMAADQPRALLIPVLPSQAVGTNVILLDARGILYADEGGVNIDVSREASVQMNTTPDNPATDATVLRSLWQENLVGLRVDRFINWKRARLASVKYVSGANYA